MSTTATTSQPAKTGIRKLNIGALATKPAATRTEYPVLEDPTGDIALLAADLIRESEELESLEGSINAKKGELRRLGADQYFTAMHGKGDIPSSMSARTEDGREVLVTFQNRYKALPDESTIIATIGEEKTARFFRQKLAFKVDCDKVPEEKLAAIYEDLTALFDKHNCAAALSATQGIVPTEDFHTLRHSQLDVDTNKVLDLACPIVAMIKTKGRKK